MCSYYKYSGHCVSFTRRSNCERSKYVNTYYLCCFSVLWVCPTCIGCGCQVISCFGHHHGLNDTLGLDLMLVSIGYQTRWIQAQAALLWISKVQGYDHVCNRWSAKKKKTVPISVVTQQNTSNALF